MSGKRTKTAPVKGGNGKAGKVARDLSEYDSSRNLPDVESCCLAFQWLLLDASKSVVKLSGMNEKRASGYAHEYADQYQDDQNHSILELTVKRIWFAYLHTWTKAGQHYSKIYPEMRVSFRDLFLSETRRALIARHLSVTVGKRIEEEMIHEMQIKLRNGDQTSADSGDPAKSKGATRKSNKTRGSNSSKTAAAHKPIISIPKLCSQVFKSQRTRDRHRLLNGCYQIDQYQAVLQIQPSLTLLLSILQLALIHLKTGHAAYHLTSWAANGSLSHALNGYTLLPSGLQERVAMAKKFFISSFVPPADTVDDLTFLLAASIGWLDEAIPKVLDPPSRRKRKTKTDTPEPNKLISVYNVPMLAARMAQDLGLDQKVLDNALSLMGLPSQNENDQRDSNSKEKTPKSNAITSLNEASPELLYTPLHVAAVLVVACKLCPGWEHWIIHFSGNAKFVPWNDSQLKLLMNGTALDHYIDFLKGTALNELDSSSTVSHFFRTLNENMTQESQTTQGAMASMEHPSVLQNPLLLTGEISPSANNNHSNQSFPSKAQCIRSKKRRKGADRIETSESLHPSYRRLIEYICYTLEETNPAKLHQLVFDLEKMSK